MGSAVKKPAPTINESRTLACCWCRRTSLVEEEHVGKVKSSTYSGVLLLLLYVLCGLSPSETNPDESCVGVRNDDGSNSVRKALIVSSSLSTYKNIVQKRMSCY